MQAPFNFGPCDLYEQYFKLKLHNCFAYFIQNIYPCPAELFQLYFLSFEAGIANAISSFKWRKI